VTTPRVEHLVVRRTARYLTLVAERDATEIWFALHGYGQLAADFARAMEPVACDGRLVVVPEGLSRFYLESPGGTHANARVGATWMTREDRDAEISDHVHYLDALFKHVVAGPREARPRVRVLGFSQGVATAARWLARGRAAADHVILWAGQLPDDVGPATMLRPDRTTRLTYVIGDRDELVSRDGIERSAERLSAAGAPFERLTFEGGHRLDRETLRRLTEDTALNAER